MGNQYDYIIIGSGIAGLMTAYYAATQNAGRNSVLLISKGGATQSNTFYAQGGIAAATSPTDNTKSHIEDTLKAGHHKNNKKAVEFIIKKAPEIIAELKKDGIKFANDLKLEGGHSAHRISYNKDSIGKTLVTNFTKKVSSLPNIKILRNHFVTDLIVEKKQCTGIAIVNNNKQQSRINYLYGKRIVICTGGIGQLYTKTTNPQNATGDGIAIAHRAGCKMQDLQYIQFHPTALDLPKKSKQSHLFLLSETLRGEGALLLNKKLVRFMLKAHPEAELGPRDIISKQIFKELKKGPVYLDLRHIPIKNIKTKYPTIHKELTKHNLNPAKNLIPISPAAHYLCGGIHTNLKAQTNIKNLYAVGESTHTGLHGANRLASNSLLEAIVMAKQATITPLPKKQFLPKIENPTKAPTTPSSRAFTEDNSSTSIATIKKLQKIMWQNAGPLSTTSSLKKALTQIQNLPHPKEPSETLNMLQTAELIIKAKLTPSK